MGFFPRDTCMPATIAGLPTIEAVRDSTVCRETVAAPL
jgi:hypothetical protein